MSDIAVLLQTFGVRETLEVKEGVMQATRMPVQTAEPEKAGLLRLVLASIWGVISLAMFGFAVWMLYDILDIYGSLEGEPWDLALLLMGGAAVMGTVAVAVGKPGAPRRLLLATFLTIAVLGLFIFGAMVALI